jgi:hypothetical protein
MAKRQQVATEAKLQCVYDQFEADTDLIGEDEDDYDDEVPDPGKAQPYVARKFIVQVNIFIHGRGGWQQHATYLLNMCPLRHLLIALVIVLLRGSLFTKKKWARAVDMHRGLNIGGIEVIRKMKVLKKNESGLVWYSSTIQKVHRAIENEMKKEIQFKISGGRFEDTWIDGVEHCAK